MKLCHQKALNSSQHKIRLFSMCRKRFITPFLCKALEQTRKGLSLNYQPLWSTQHLTWVLYQRKGTTRTDSLLTPDHQKITVWWWLLSPVVSQTPPSTDQLLSLNISIFVFLLVVPLLIFNYFLWTWREIMAKHASLGAQAPYCSSLLRSTSPTAMRSESGTGDSVCKGFRDF